MSRFEGDYFEDDYNYEYEEGEEEFSGEDHAAMIGAAIPAELMDRWKQTETNLETQKINFVVLQQTIKMLEKSWLWRFRSMESRIRLLSDTYYAMMDLVSVQD